MSALLSRQLGLYGQGEIGLLTVPQHSDPLIEADDYRLYAMGFGTYELRRHDERLRIEGVTARTLEGALLIGFGREPACSRADFVRIVKRLFEM